MSNIVFILGAGASKQCGAPLMADFLDVASNLYRTNAVQDKKREFELVFKAIGSLQAVHSKSQLDLTNIESIFTAFELAQLLGKLPDFESQDIPQVIAALKELIVRTIEVTVQFPTRYSAIGTPLPYDAFAQLLVYLRSKAHPNQTVSVITFNYDIAVDKALFDVGMGPDYALSTESQNANPVQLLKLHGSLNWASGENRQGVHPLHLRDYLSHYRFMASEERGTCTIPIGSQLKEYFSQHTKIAVEREPVIVPPTWNKAEHHQALANVWASAAKQLEEAESIFIIGYSLPETDAFFRLLYALGTVGDNPLLRIIVYNPDDSGQVDARFRSMLGPGAVARYQYKELRFQNAIDDIKSYFPSRQ